MIAESAWKAGELGLAEEAIGHAISKNEFADEARVLLALINLNKTKTSTQESGQFADPSVNAESAIRHMAAEHPGNAWIYAIWGDFLRANGSYRTAAETFHKGVLRSDPLAAQELLSAKEQLAKQQKEPAKTASSLSALTAMTGEQSLVAAFAALQQHQTEDAVAFLQRAQDLYSPQVFRELMKDIAFNEYRADVSLKPFFKPDHTIVSPLKN
jgi:tetratricopeptide (TPR) repeat protein